MKKEQKCGPTDTSYAMITAFITGANQAYWRVETRRRIVAMCEKCRETK